MGTITTASIIQKAQTLLLDATGVRWPSSELLGWLNDGQREIVVFKPNASIKHQSVKLVAGTRQSLPSDGVQLIDIPCNMGSDGATPGRAIRLAMREVFDAQVPTWHSDTPDLTVNHYMYSVLDPKTFYVYPPQPSYAQTYVDVAYAYVPQEATLSGAITVDDIYQPMLLDYMLYRAFSKDSEFGDANRASAHQQAYLAALTGKARVEGATNPNVSAPANIMTPNPA